MASDDACWSRPFKQPSPTGNYNYHIRIRVLHCHAAGGNCRTKAGLSSEHTHVRLHGRGVEKYTTELHQKA